MLLLWQRIYTLKPAITLKRNSKTAAGKVILKYSKLKNKEL